MTVLVATPESVLVQATFAYSLLARRLLQFLAMSHTFLTARHALFLDFDGTLVNIAPRPHDVRVDPVLLEHLRALQSALKGALAIVTGRALADVDHFLAPLQLPVAGEHGAQFRWEDGSTQGVEALPLDDVVNHLRPLLIRHPALLLEKKRTGLALHFRQAPQLEAVCFRVLADATACIPGAELIGGKCVFEIKSANASKGRAIEAFMGRHPFADRIPLFIGDDVTDEPGFAAVQARGGMGIKVGEGATQARARLSSPAAVAAWLALGVEPLTPNAAVADQEKN